MNKLSKQRSTNVITDCGGINVWFHGTLILTFDQERIILTSGGYKTATTKRRMNQASEEFDLGFRVYQEGYRWYVNYKNEKYVFAENLTLKR